jgi:hypothetical protein
MRLYIESLLSSDSILAKLQSSKAAKLQSCKAAKLQSKGGAGAG